ncbi:hypothetical protein [Stygiolobus caldivivus]|uniref:Uncharacterized protein n=1 Tax=Stygiolobus caldivivus TaxID=2824673 RepID=A0A8D5ZJ73_9CREN|nr:hypothetical protein [Stygiolobus caldivivus]BCU70306.1 hypothetical protein KN1_16030 [Stygiolobus caldivivus]
MEYRLRDIVNDEGEVVSVPKGFSAIMLGKRLMLIKGRNSILLVKVFKNVYAMRVVIHRKTYYRFVTYDSKIIENDNIVLPRRKKDNNITKALDVVIRKLEEVEDIDKIKDAIFYLYLAKNCLKGDKQSCSELEEQLFFEAES